MKRQKSNTAFVGDQTAKLAKTPQKILLVTSFYPPYHLGGACMHVYDLAQALATQGHDVHVVYSVDSYYLKRKNTPIHRFSQHSNITLHPLQSPFGKLAPLYSYLTGKFSYRKKLYQIFSQDFDIIHYHNISLFGPEILLLGNAKKVYTAHDHWLLCPANATCSSPRCPNTFSCTLHHLTSKPPQFWRFTSLLKKALLELDTIFVPSQYLLKKLQVHYPDLPFVHLPNFVQPFSYGEQKKAPMKHPYFLFVGMLEKHKGIIPLLDAFRLNDEHLVIAGEGSESPFVQEYIRKHNLQKRVHSLGFVPRQQLQSYYTHAQACILPSTCAENNPLTILEALSCGTPTLGSTLGGIPEILTPLSSQLLFDPRETDAIAKCIQRFLSTSFTSHDIQSYFKHHFSEQAFIEKYEKEVFA